MGVVVAPLAMKGADKPAVVKVDKSRHRGLDWVMARVSRSSLGLKTSC